MSAGAGAAELLGGGEYVFQTMVGVVLPDARQHAQEEEAVGGGELHLGCGWLLGLCKTRWDWVESCWRGRCLSSRA